ncbi:MAG: LPS-assembly protein LptD, partial [Bacteroidetes bacterium]|nr:LPS-assembly protein LptD [Bacteroidota bacterium]
MLSAGMVRGQEVPPAGSVQLGPRGTAAPPADSLPPQGFGRPAPPRSANLDSIQISPDALDEQVDYQSVDSMFFDIKKKQIHLFGQAEVKFQTMTIQADYILIDWDSNIMSAQGKRLPGGEWLGKPHFTEGDQNFTASKIKYNFKTYKGIIYDAQTMQEGMNIVGEKGKFFGTGNDTTKANVIYNKNAIFSTCDLEHPHFGIRSNKQKIVQDKVAIVGPCNLVIGDIPTPLWLPFGFFPLKLGKRTGLIFPRNYEYSEAWGFGLNEVGWYLPMGDNWDLTLTGDIYLKGTFRVHGASNYRKRYKFNGSATIDFAYQRTEVEGLPEYSPSLSIRWNHTQDAKAHPYRSLGGNINFQTSDYQRSNQTDAQSRLQSSISSNMSYRQRFDKPFDLSVAFSHSQNTNTRDVTISFPTVNFQTQSLYPFKRKVKTGGEQWYERIQMRYTSEARNQFTAKDSTIFTQKTLDDAKFGLRHNLTASTSFNLLKYFTVSPSANYKEVWYFKTVNKNFDPMPTIELDTIYNPEDSSEIEVLMDTTEFGNIIDDENFDFKPLRQYNAGASMSTKLFGTLLFKKGKVRGLRHVMTPNFGFNYTPDFTNPDWGYFKTVKKDLRNDELLTYSVFENNRLSGFDQPSTGGKQMALSYGFGNLFEAKIFSKRDSTLKNVKLFNSVNVGGSYNFAADSMNWSVVNITGNTNFFNGLTSFRFG